MSGDLTVPKAPVALGPHGLNPDSLDGLWRCCNLVKMSGLAPRSLETAEKMMVAACHGRELGLSFMQSLQNIAVINGKPGIFGDAAMALVQSSDCCEYVEESMDGTGDKMKAVCVSKRKGRAKEVRTEFSVDDAKKAGLWGKAGPWTNYPKRMLQFRARGFNFRDNFADKISGLRTVEELRDFPDSEDAPAMASGSTIPANSLDIVEQELLPPVTEPGPSVPFVGDPWKPTKEEIEEAELQQANIPF